MNSKYKTVTELTKQGYEYTEFSNGYKEWFLNGKYHREDGPAIEHPGGYKAWCLNGKHHREDGPAVERSDGSKAWYLNGKEITLKTKSENPKVKNLQKLMQVQELIDS